MVRARPTHRRRSVRSMKFPFLTTLLLLSTATLASAETPRKGNLTKYTQLWQNSPFTSKPPPGEIGPVVNPFEGYTLLGVSPIDGGYRVTIINTKDTNERVFIETNGNRNAGFEIVKISRKPGDFMGTTVLLKKDGQQGSVSYDEKNLTIAAAKPAAPQPGQQPNLPPGLQPQQQPNNQGNQPNVRRPRPRVVAPPTAGGNNNQPQGNANQRPNRRGR